MVLRHTLLLMTSSNRQSFIATNWGFNLTVIGGSRRRSSLFIEMAYSLCSKALVRQVADVRTIRLVQIPNGMPTFGSRMRGRYMRNCNREALRSRGRFVTRIMVAEIS